MERRRIVETICRNFQSGIVGATLFPICSACIWIVFEISAAKRRRRRRREQYLRRVDTENPQIPDRKFQNMALQRGKKSLFAGD